MNLQCVSEFVTLGRGEDDAGSQADAHLGSIEVHPPRSGSPSFKSTPSRVCTAPLAEIIGSRDASGRVAKWAIALAPYTIFYHPRTAIKSQALADFLVDWAETQYLPPAPDSTH